MRHRDRRPIGARPIGLTPRAGMLAIAMAIVAGLARADDTAKPTSYPKIEDYAPPREFVDAGGIKTHFIAEGTAGRPIVFVHGFGSCTYTWRLNLKPLAAKGFRAIAVDIKGFGLTAKPKDGQYHLVAYADHLLAFLDAMKLDRPILVGNSMGGAIIARLALLHPERVAGIVLVDTASLDFALRRTPPAVAAPRSPLAERLKSGVVRSLVTREAVAAGLRGAYHDPKFVTDEAVEVYYRPLLIDGAPEALVAMGDPPVEPLGTLPALKSLKVPAMIVWGRHDRVIPVAMADNYAREIPGARVFVLEKSGHMPHEEEPDAFNAMVAEFASKTPPTTR